MLRYRKNVRSLSANFYLFSLRTMLVLTLFAGHLVFASPLSIASSTAEVGEVNDEEWLPSSMNLTRQQQQQVLALQLAFNRSGGECSQCQPPCLPIDPIDCPFNRTVFRSDCTCCHRPVCARHIGQSCNNHVLVCDNQLGLTCDNDTNTCSGPFNLRAFEVTHNSSLLKWRPPTFPLPDNQTLNTSFSLSFTDQFNETGSTEWKHINLSADESGQTLVQQLSPNKLYYFRMSTDNDTTDSNQFEILIIQTKDGCAFENGSAGVGETYWLGCQLKCVCEENGSTSCSSRCPPPPSSSLGANCKEVVDPHDDCCKVLSCEHREGHSMSPGEPQVIVTGRTPVSLTIAWDDFKVPGPTFHQGYTVEYRPATDDGGPTSTWQTVKVEDGPFTTIGNLTPNTAYEVRVFIWEDEEAKKYGPSTEIIVLSTEDGCIWDSKALTVGETYNKGCIGRCVCLGNDNSECGPRCSPPYFTKGIAANDSECNEEPLADDSCCVLLLCASKSHEQTSTTIAQTETSSTTTTVSTTTEVLSVGECPVNVVDTTGSCSSDCKTDADCSSGRRCCLSECGSQICVVTNQRLVVTTVATPSNDSCSAIKCGPKGVCHQYQGKAQCFCLPGTTGNPYDVINGCSNAFGVATTVATPANETCSGVKCGPNGVCHQYQGKGQCFCLPGTTGNPYDVINGCLSAIGATTTMTTPTNDPCSGVKCGPNAVCNHYQGKAQCFCLPGMTGNPYDVVNGCLNAIEGSTTVASPTNDSCSGLECGPNVGGTTTVATPANDSCSGLECGPNAVCHQNQGKSQCFCVPGTSGNPHDVINGCLKISEVLTKVSTPANDSCSGVSCGPNAVCQPYKGKAECYCVPGTSGNPRDVISGCLKVSAMLKSKVKAGCTVGNATYLVGESFYRGCDDKCECVNKDNKYEISCQPRCVRKEEKHRNFDETACHFQVDPEDECCKKLVCDPFLENDAEQEVLKNVSHPFGSGCEYKGKTYKRDEHFYEGCNNSCHCLGAGEVSCNPRCPPASTLKPGCVAMPHPSDSECCTLVICNPHNFNFTLPPPTLDDEDSVVMGNNETLRENTTDVSNNQTSLFNTSTLLEETVDADSLDNVESDNSTTESGILNSTSTTVDPDGMETFITIIHTNSPPAVNVTNSTITEESEFNTTENSTMSRNGHNIFNASEDDIASKFEEQEDSTMMDDTTALISDDGNSTTESWMHSTTVNSTKDGLDSNSTSENATIVSSNSTESVDTLETSTVKVETTTVEVESTSEDSENGTKSQKEVRLLQDVDSQVVEFPKHVGRLADIHRILLIDSTTIRIQMLLAPSIMEKIFMDTDTVFVLYTNNITHVDLVDWERYPLNLQRNLAFVSVDRSDIAAETIITELEPDRQYNFMIALQKDIVDPDVGIQYQQLSDVEATVTLRLGDGMCEFMGRTFNIGERLYDECNAVCDCVEGPNVPMVVCEAILCPSQINPEKSGCLEWNVDLAFIPRAPHCCPEATCKYGSMCLYKGRKFGNLAKIPQSLVEDCEQECTCVAGNVSCAPRCQPVSATPPEEVCEGVYEQRLHPGDHCCKFWLCVREEPAVDNSSVVIVESTTSAVPHVVETTLETDNMTSGGNVEQNHEHDNKTMNIEPEITLPQPECVYDNGTYKLNEQWRVGKGHRQKLCTCLPMRNGSAGVECQGGCPSIVNQPVELIPDCPPENVVIWDVPDLCPYVVCNKSDVGRGVKNVTVDMLNATAIRVTFIIPSIYVGLYGQVEILYTMDLTHSDDTTTWNKEVFSGPSNQFENTKLSHEMTGLQPDTEYFLKVVVVIKNSKNTDTSEIMTIRMPPLPTTTTTTTTTTLPPQIHLDPKLSVSDVTTSSAKINWRSFDASEKRYVDGVQLHYKLHNDDTQQWSQTLLIHRDVVFYTMEHLKPNSEYDVNIVIVTSPNVSTEIMVGEPVTFKTLAVFDDYEFNLTLIVDKARPYSIDIIWAGVPYPEHKYVNVYRILYQKMSGKETEPSFIYQPPKGNQFKAKVDNLLPETNYTIWLEAFLTNGKIRSSNMISMPTRPGIPAVNQSEKEKLESSTENTGKNGGNAYYAALIVVAVIAALCALGFVILLVVLLRKQSSAKAPITTTKSHSAYDNPTYKTYDSELENGKSQTQ